MAGGNEYLNKLDEIEASKYRKKSKGHYKEAKQRGETYQVLKREGNALLRDNKLDHSESFAIGFADRLMKFNHNGRHNFDLTLLGAKILDKYGKGNRESVKRKLLRAVNEDSSIGTHEISEVRELLRDYSSKSGVENRATATLITSLLSILFGLFFLSPNITGDAVGILSSNGSDIWGVIMFFFGLFGLFVSLRG